MPDYKAYAVKISLDSLDQITEVNDGVRPKVQKQTTYFITSEDPNVANVILSETQFMQFYHFVDPQREHEFTEVREIR